jgi:hypothetical protein
LTNFILSESNAERVIDSIELSFEMIGQIATVAGGRLSDSVEKATRELNSRFQEHAFGYRFENGEIIRIDSEFIHQEIVKPALAVLSGRMYQGAQDEFLKAHEHYRHGNTKEAMNEALKAIESTMKAICDKRKWAYDTNAPAQKLIQNCFDNGLIPLFWQSQLTALKTLLESSVPTGRNKLSGHGQGTTPVEVPQHIAGYVLHMTAAAVVFLADSEKNLAT